MASIPYHAKISSPNTTESQSALASIAETREALHEILREADPVRVKFETELDNIDPYSLSVEEVEDRLQTFLARIIAALETDLREIRSCRATEDRARSDRAKQRRQAARETLKAEQFEARQNAERERLKRSEAARLEGIAARKREVAERSARVAAQREVQRREAEERKAERERQKAARLRQFRARLKRGWLVLNGAY